VGTQATLLSAASRARSAPTLRMISMDMAAQLARIRVPSASMAGLLWRIVRSP
jgi:hypothetical protein